MNGKLTVQLLGPGMLEKVQITEQSQYYQNTESQLLTRLVRHVKIFNAHLKFLTFFL